MQFGSSLVTAVLYSPGLAHFQFGLVCFEQLSELWLKITICAYTFSCSVLNSFPSFQFVFFLGLLSSFSLLLLLLLLSGGNINRHGRTWNCINSSLLGRSPLSEEESKRVVWLTWNRLCVSDVFDFAVWPSVCLSEQMWATSPPHPPISKLIFRSWKASSSSQHSLL